MMRTVKVFHLILISNSCNAVYSAVDNVTATMTAI